MTRIVERTWPYVVALGITTIWFMFGYNMANSERYDNALDSTLNMCAILLGFISAMFPVILSLRKEGNYVDKIVKLGGGLLKSYYVETIISGFLLIIIVTISYFRMDARECIKDILFYTWLFCVMEFVCCSVRCMYFLIRLILPKNQERRIPEEGEAERRYKEKMRKEEKGKEI